MTKEIPTFPFAGQRIYRNGEEIEYTGKTVTDEGGLVMFCMVSVGDTWRPGHRLLVYTPPVQSNV